MSLGCFAGQEGFSCSFLWILMIVLFFISAMLRRQINDLLGMDFSLIGATVGAELSFVIIMLITKSFQWSFIGGIVVCIIAGFVSASFMPDSDSERGGGEGWF